MNKPSARAFIGVGSNLQPEENVLRAIQALREVPGVTLTGISTFYRTAALSDPSNALAPSDPDTADPDFLNGVLEVRTVLSPGELLTLFSDIEQSLGRERGSNRFAPRTMDLDLLLYGSGEGGEAEVEWHEIGADGARAHRDIERRAFVAHPLLELAPNLILPPHRVPLRALAGSFETPGGAAEMTLTDNLRRRFLPS